MIGLQQIIDSNLNLMQMTVKIMKKEMDRIDKLEEEVRILKRKVGKK